MAGAALPAPEGPCPMLDPRWGYVSQLPAGRSPPPPGRPPGPSSRDVSPDRSIGPPEPRATLPTTTRGRDPSSGRERPSKRCCGGALGRRTRCAARSRMTTSRLVSRALISIARVPQGRSSRWRRRRPAVCRRRRKRRQETGPVRPRASAPAHDGQPGEQPGHRHRPRPGRTGRRGRHPASRTARAWPVEPATDNARGTRREPSE